MYSKELMQFQNSNSCNCLCEFAPQPPNTPCPPASTHIFFISNFPQPDILPDKSDFGAQEFINLLNGMLLAECCCEGNISPGNGWGIGDIICHA